MDFSASFLSHLENSQESDYTRAQYAEKYIQDRVAEELKKLEKQTIEKFKDTTDLALAKDDGSVLSVPALNEKLAKFAKQLEENSKSIEVGVSDDIKTARKSVVECLKDNHGRALNCWDEVEHFKQLVHSM